MWPSSPEAQAACVPRCSFWQARLGPGADELRFWVEDGSTGSHCAPAPSIARRSIMPVWTCHWKRRRFASLMARARSSGRRKWLPSLVGYFSRSARPDNVCSSCLSVARGADESIRVAMSAKSFTERQGLQRRLYPRPRPSPGRDRQCSAISSSARLPCTRWPSRWSASATSAASQASRAASRCSSPEALEGATIGNTAAAHGRAPQEPPARLRAAGQRRPGYAGPAAVPRA